MPRARTSPDPPDGLVYDPELLTADEERGLLEELERLDFQEIVMKGVVARRTAVRYGMGYDYDRRTPTEGAEPFPDWLLPMRDRAAALAGVEGDDLRQALVQRYPEGAPIGWHRDSPAYELVVGISLLSPARLRLRRGPADDRVAYEVQLEPRSAYVLSGEARWKWEHHVPPAKSLRYSITFRSLRA
jgi:alkylated DNA repair protein (DNA oxidative demethylase)